MKMNSEFNKESLEYLYKEYKGLILPIGAIAISILLFLIFLLPQLMSIPAKKTEMDVENVKLDKLNDLSKILSSIDVVILESNLGIVGRVLPVEKNFESILGGIFSAANQSSVLVLSYDYAQDNISTNLKLSKFPVVKFNVEIAGSPDQVVDFINQIYKTFPISEVEDIQIRGNTASLSLSYFYKPFASRDSVDKTQIRNLTNKESGVLTEITTWNGDSQSALGDIKVVPDSSDSGTLDSPF